MPATRARTLFPRVALQTSTTHHRLRRHRTHQSTHTKPPTQSQIRHPTPPSHRPTRRPTARRRATVRTTTTRTNAKHASRLGGVVEVTDDVEWLERVQLGVCDGDAYVIGHARHTPLDARRVVLQKVSPQVYVPICSGHKEGRQASRWGAGGRDTEHERNSDDAAGDIVSNNATTATTTTTTKTITPPTPRTPTTTTTMATTTAATTAATTTTATATTTPTTTMTTTTATTQYHKLRKCSLRKAAAIGFLAPTWDDFVRKGGCGRGRGRPTADNRYKARLTYTSTFSPAGIRTARMRGPTAHTTCVDIRMAFSVTLTVCRQNKTHCRARDTHTQAVEGGQVMDRYAMQIHARHKRASRNNEQAAGHQASAALLASLPA